jgi:hypothetical protein
MKTALFGFAGTGKTELFRALAGPEKIMADQAIVKVPEPRLDPLVELFAPPKVTYSEIEYLDLPGGGAKKEGLGQRVVNAIRPYDCLLAVLDAFSGLSSPEEQWRDIETDLVIADLSVVEKRLDRLQHDKKKAKDLVNPQEEILLHEVRQLLDQGSSLRNTTQFQSKTELKGFGLLSAKPIIYVWNAPEDRLHSLSLPEEQQAESHIILSAKFERELTELESPEDRATFLEDIGIARAAREIIISKTYQMLGLITFLTAGEKEVRAWAIPKDSTAQEAAGAIHSDIQKGFIRAEVLGWHDFEQCQTFKKAKEKGVLRLEGKEYIVQDGDIITFRFNI